MQANYYIENNEYMMSHINQVFSLKNERKKVLIPVFTKYSVSSDLIDMTPKFVHKLDDSPQIGECTV